MATKPMLAVALLLSGCATIDTGEISYRRAEKLSVDHLNRRIADYPDICYPYNRPKGDKKGKIDNKCPPLAPARLFRQNIGTGDKITSPDVYSIRLDHGLIAVLSEAPFSLRRLIRGKHVFRAVGEVVVLANTFEFPDDEHVAEFTGEGKTPARFTDLGDLSQSRVVYYSPDVEQGQNLNFSNIPLQEPKRYTGNPVGIQIIVIELDRVSAGVGALLKKLASFGQSASFAPGGEASKLLLDLGGSLAAQNHDDIVFEYRFVLDPSDGQIGTGSAPFEAGRYVLVREDDRADELNWRNMVLDYNTGRLFKRDTEKEPRKFGKADPQPARLDALPESDRKRIEGETQKVYKNYDKNTYFTINIIKHPAGTQLSHYSFRTFDELGQMIQADADRRDKPIGELVPSVEAKLMEMRGRSWTRELIKAWDATVQSAKRYSALQRPTDTSPCDLSPTLAAQGDVAQTELRIAALGFAAMFADAVAVKQTDGGEAKPELPLADQQKLLASLVPYFAPFDTEQVTQDELMNADLFHDSYTGKNAPAFADAVVKRAKQNGETNSCAQMIALGYATAK